MSERMVSGYGSAERALSEVDVDAVARRVVELLVEGSVPPVTFIDTATVARMFSVREEWVRAHAFELGAIRVGDGEKGVLRFHADRVFAAMERRRVGAGSPASVRRRPGPRRGRASRRVKLLPLPEDAAA